MLLVNNPGSWDHLYAPLDHAKWHGWTFTDLIFPCFLWMVGVSMTLSFSRRVETGADRGELFRHVLIRAAIIFGLGMFLATFPFGLLPTHNFVLARVRIPGVLQRIAVCYLFASAIFLRTTWRGQLAWIVGLLAASWAAMKLIPVPGYGPGHLDEPVGNLAWWVDSHVLAGHTWRGAPAPGFDPEGIVSTVPALATTLLGALAGHVLRTAWPQQKKTLALLLGGAALLALGELMNVWLPINKNLWTSSYTVFMAGWSSVIMAVFYWVIDVRGWQRWATPFVIYGMNAIFFFVFSGVVGRLFGLISWKEAVVTDGVTKDVTVTLHSLIYRTAFKPYFEPINASLAFAIAFVLVNFLLAWLMWRKKWFVKV